MNYRLFDLRSYLPIPEFRGISELKSRYKI